MEMATATQRDPLHGITRARELLTDEAFRGDLAASNGVPADDPVLLKFLALCIDEGFSPVADHVWLLPKRVMIASTDGDGEREDSTFVPMVGRDGLLYKAHSTKGLPGGWRGLRSGVICANDTFEVEDNGEDVSILHRYAALGPGAGTADPSKYRGEVLGAWAKCTMDGEPPTFYVAPLHEHAQQTEAWAWDPQQEKRRPLFVDEQGVPTFDATGPNRVPRAPLMELAEMWRYLSTMIQKAAQSYVLRIALGVSGFVPADELRDVKTWQQTAVPIAAAAAPPAPAAPGFDLADEVKDPQIRERLRLAIEEANAASPMSWGPAKQAMSVRGRSTTELRKLAERIENENHERRRRAERQTQREGLEQRAARLRRSIASARPKEKRASLGAELEQVEAELRDLR